MKCADYPTPNDVLVQQSDGIHFFTNIPEGATIQQIKEIAGFDPSTRLVYDLYATVRMKHDDVAGRPVSDNFRLESAEDVDMLLRLHSSMMGGSYATVVRIKAYRPPCPDILDLRAAIQMTTPFFRALYKSTGSVWGKVAWVWWAFWMLSALPFFAKILVSLVCLSFVPFDEELADKTEHAATKKEKKPAGKESASDSDNSVTPAFKSAVLRAIVTMHGKDKGTVKELIKKVIESDFTDVPSEVLAVVAATQ